MYWKLFGKGIPAAEVLSHRMIWSTGLLLLLLMGLGRWRELLGVWRSPRLVFMLFLSASLLACNWGIYIYGVNSDRVVETSLGYFINPLVTVVLGFLFMQERFTRWQQIAVGLATLGVGLFIWQLGQVPWIALILAISFAFYGLLRKLVPVAPMVGLAVETMLLMPVALAFALHWQATGTGHFTQTPGFTLLFVGSGLVTSLPLLWFNNAAKRLRLSTLGLFQYLAPSLQLALGVLLYHEPFTSAHGLTFGLIWTGLLIYSLSARFQRDK